MSAAEADGAESCSRYPAEISDRAHERQSKRRMSSIAVSSNRTRAGLVRSISMTTAKDGLDPVPVLVVLLIAVSIGVGLGALIVGRNTSVKMTSEAPTDDP